MILLLPFPSFIVRMSLRVCVSTKDAIIQLNVSVYAQCQPDRQHRPQGMYRRGTLHLSTSHGPMPPQAGQGAMVSKGAGMWAAMRKMIGVLCRGLKTIFRLSSMEANLIQAYILNDHLTTSSDYLTTVHLLPSDGVCWSSTTSNDHTRTFGNYLTTI